jgi:long-chain acyl-CoA synthetase
VEVEAEYRYQDGTLQRVRARVPIQDLKEVVAA